MATNEFRQQATRKSDTYDDTLAPGVALEDSSTDLAFDLNALRSQINRVIDSTGTKNWYDSIPLIFGKQRGLFQLATDTFGQTGDLANVHRTYDQLVHDISENSFREIVRDSEGIVTDIIVYTDATKTTKIREQNISRASGLISQIVTQQYDAGGSVSETQTETISRTGGLIDDITMSLS